MLDKEFRVEGLGFLESAAFALHAGHGALLLGAAVVDFPGGGRVGPGAAVAAADRWWRRRRLRQRGGFGFRV